MKKSQMISPIEVLKLPKNAAAQIMRGLDETNRYVLIGSMMRCALDAEKQHPPAVSEKLAAVFAELGSAQLKLYAYDFVLAAMNSRKPRSPAAAQLVMDVHAAIVPMLLTDVFDVTAGEAGIGTKPKLGTNRKDRTELADWKPKTEMQHAARYEPLVAAARAAGTLIVEDSV